MHRAGADDCMFCAVPVPVPVAVPGGPGPVPGPGFCAVVWKNEDINKHLEVVRGTRTPVVCSELSHI